MKSQSTELRLRVVVVGRTYSSGGSWRLAQSLTAVWKTDIKQVLDDRIMGQIGIPPARWGPLVATGGEWKGKRLISRVQGHGGVQRQSCRRRRRQGFWFVGENDFHVQPGLDPVEAVRRPHQSERKTVERNLFRSK